MNVNIALLTVTDTRTFDNDKSGAILVKKIKEANHNLIDRKIVKDDYKSSHFPPGYGEAVKEKGMMSAEETARYIFNGVKKRKRYVRPTSVGQLTVWLNKLFPKLNDKLAAKYYN